MKLAPVATDANTLEEYIEGFTNYYKDQSFWYLDILKEYASKVDHITECGILQGQSLAIFLSTEPEVLIGYDIDLSNIHIPTYNKFQKNTKLIIKCKSSIVPPAVYHTDLLFLDTVHTYEHVKKELWLNGNSANRYIIVHDTNYPVKSDIKVRNACYEFVNNFPFVITLECTTMTGLIVMERKCNIKI